MSKLTSETHHSFCRFCHASCPILVDVEDGRPVRVIGDVKNPTYGGYTCAKGRALPEQHANPSRLLHSQKRQPDGSYAAIPAEQAMDEIAAQAQGIIDRHGPRAISMYNGTFSFPNPTSRPVAYAWLEQVGSQMSFTTATIDQPGKMIARALHGRWAAGAQAFNDADTWLLFGVNPTVSKSIGVPSYNPARHLHRAVKRGMKLVVIDPRYTEAAKLAEVFLQCRPGEDPTIVAGILRVVIAEKLYDADFVRENTQHLAELERAVEPFTPDYVAQRAGVDANELVRAARVFAAGTRGCANAGTGPNMSPRGNLTEYLLLCLNTLCGRWRRAGEALPNPGVLTPPIAAKAQPIPPGVGWGFGEKLRVRNLTDTMAGLPTAALADEILLPGDGQVKALFSIGGNPMAAWPDQQKTHEAMKALELNVTLDIKMSATAKVADYVIAPKLSLEMPGMTLPAETLTTYSMGYSVPYGMYSPAVVDVPEGSDLIEEWEFFYGLAQRMGYQLEIESASSWGPEPAAPVRTKLDMVNKPTNDDLFAALTQGSRIPLEEVKRHPRGNEFHDPPSIVAAKDAGCDAKLEFADPTMIEELADVASETLDRHPGYSHLLVSRRLPDVHNSAGRDIDMLLRKYSYNPAFMNPGDLRALGIQAGDTIEITSEHDTILGIAEPEEAVRPGVVSMPHGFGDVPEEGKLDPNVRKIGSNTGRLTSVDRDYDPYTGIPLMSSIPVDVRPHIEQGPRA